MTAEIEIIPDWDMNGNTTEAGYEAQIIALRAELDQAAGVINDRNREIADLISALQPIDPKLGNSYWFERLYIEPMLREWFAGPQNQNVNSLVEIMRFRLMRIPMKLMEAKEAKFEKQTYGAVVATILETDDSIVEIQERNDGVYGLIVHHRRQDRDDWDDLTAYLKPEHFEMLGSIARRMRGEAAT